MTLPALLDDALASTPDGIVVRLSLPWIRSLPGWSLGDVALVIDGALVEAPVAAPAGWWFLQDRVALTAPARLAAGTHDVAVSFTLRIPYLPGPGGGSLTLPFRFERALVLDGGAPTTTPAPLAPAALAEPDLPAGWAIAASAFNWTPEVIRAASPAVDLAAGIVERGTASVIEIEPGQLWRSFPDVTDAEATALRERLAAAGGRVTITGGSFDDWDESGRRLDDAERLALFAPQLRLANRVGAIGVRVPFGQAGPGLLRLLQPELARHDVVLFEEIQGQQTLDLPHVAANLETLTELDDPRVRVLIDISMLMPSLPPSYLAQLREGGVDAALLDRLEHAWRDPETHAAVLATLRSGTVPPAVHTLFMNLLVRFGRSSVADIEPLLPLTRGIHLKFWDLDDTDDRVSQPIRDLGAALARRGYDGTFTSEWGGHEWIDADADATTRAHIVLAQAALADGASTAATASALSA